MIWKVIFGNTHHLRKVDLILLNVYNTAKPKLNMLNGLKAVKRELKDWKVVFYKAQNKDYLWFVSGLGVRYAFSVALSVENRDETLLNLADGERNSLDWSLLIPFLWEDIWLLVGAFLASLLAAFLNTLIPISLGRVVNLMSNMLKGEMGAGQIYNPLWNSSLSILGLYLCQAAATFVYISLLSVVGERLAVRLRTHMFSSLINQDVEFFDKQRTGELVDCLSTDVQELKSSFKLCVSQGLRSLTQIVGCVGSVVLISPVMTGATVVVIPSIVLVGTLLGSLLRKISQKAQQELIEATTMCEEVISNIRTVKAFAAESRETTAYSKQLMIASDLYIFLGYGIALFQASTNLFLNSIVLGTLYFGGRLISVGRLSPGDLMSFLVATQTIQRSLAQLSLLLGHFIKGRQAASRIFHYIKLRSTIQKLGGLKISRNSLIPEVEFKNVTFAYPTRPSQTVLEDLNLWVPAGRTVAIVGSSGHGKSTVVALLERFYDPNEGSITLGGEDLRHLDLAWLRGTVIGLINQEPVLFATSILDNIRYGRPDASMKEVVEASRLADADAFIRGFPQGYDTVLGERGVTISGGQRQRIALARVLLNDPPLLILDEATSALDPETEYAIQLTLERVARSRTVLIVAHRLSTVQRADLILVLHRGRIVESGTHSELLAKRAHYYRLMMQHDDSS